MPPSADVYAVGAPIIVLLIIGEVCFSAWRVCSPRGRKIQLLQSTKE